MVRWRKQERQQRSESPPTPSTLLPSPPRKSIAKLGKHLKQEIFVRNVREQLSAAPIPQVLLIEKYIQITSSPLVYLH